MTKQKSKELRKFMQKKRKLKRSNKAIQFIEENDDAKAKLIKKLKKEVCKAVKKIMITKSTDEENKLSNDDNLKDSAFTSKSSKNKLKFIKFAVSM